MFLFLQFKIEKIIKEKEELLKVTSVLEKETAQLRDQVERLEKELNHEKQRCDQLQTEQKVSCSTDWSWLIMSVILLFQEPVKLGENQLSKPLSS